MDIVSKTRKRFTWLMMLAITIIIVTALLAVYLVTYNNQETANRKRLNSFEEVKVTEKGSISFDGKKDTDAYMIERTSPEIGTNFSLLTDKRGKVLSVFSSLEDQPSSLYKEAAEVGWKGYNYDKVELNGRLWQFASAPAITSMNTSDERQLDNLDATYQFRFVDITESQQTLHSLLITLCVIGVSLLLLFFIFSLYFSKRAIRPLEKILDKQQQFVADASHELKTPISIIKTNCSVLYANENRTIKSQEQWLDSIKTGADRMTKLIQNLITLSKIEGSEIEMIQSDVLICDQVDELIKTYESIISEKSLKVKVNCKENIIVHSNPDLTQQALGIVLENAIKYTDNEGFIKIDGFQGKKWVEIKVYNTGNGIDPEDMDKIFDRFYRGENARTHDGSHGLGLSIAQSIMEQLAGKIDVESTEGEDATFTLRFRK